VSEINSLAALRPGDIMFGPIGGLVGMGVGLGQLALGEAFHVGRLSIRHVGIVVEPVKLLLGPTEVIYPRLVQAMPHGAEEIEMREATHWTPRHAYARLPEDYPGQAADAAAIARLMVAEGVAYSFASYAALALWRWGVKTPRLEEWIDRRRNPVPIMLNGHPDAGVTVRGESMISLPCEAICPVLADQSWSLVGKRVVEGTVPQVVTPGMMAGQLWRRRDVVWGGLGLL
jgi:hypothetical protein